VNDAITRIFLVFVVLFALLIGFTSNWAIFDAESLETKPANKRQSFEQVLVRRGTIRASDGSVIARSVERKGGAFERVYPQDGLFAHPIGYFETFLTATETERFRDKALSGETEEFDSIVDQLSGAPRIGANLNTALDPVVQRVATEQLAGRPGAVVALEPSSGRVLGMVSTPDYDPNRYIASDAYRREQNTNNETRPMNNKATLEAYPPGSTFKVVTASAAIDSGTVTPDSTFDGSSPQTFGGSPLSNDGNLSLGTIPLTEALTKSVNTVWAQVAEQVGQETMVEYMERFGFNTEPPIDLPKDELAISGERVTDENGVNTFLGPDSDQIDIWRMAIGQDKLVATPLQMATVAATVANDGVRMAPRIGTKIIDKDGRTVEDIGTEEVEEVISEESAQQVQQMMKAVVQSPAGTAANSGLEGLDAAGKTGTTETGANADLIQAWFICFAPVENPKIAVAVTVLPPNGGQGGFVAAPIAGAVMRAYLQQ
jgi:penicillin-binding protein A